MAENEEGVMYSCMYTKQKTQKRKKWHDGKAKLNLEEQSARVFALESGKFVCSIPPGSNFYAHGTFAEEPLELEAFLVDLSEAAPLTKHPENQNPPALLHPSGFGTNKLSSGAMHKMKKRRNFKSSLHSKTVSKLPQPLSHRLPSSGPNEPANTASIGSGRFAPAQRQFAGFGDRLSGSTRQHLGQSITEQVNLAQDGQGVRSYNGNDMLRVSKVGRTANQILDGILAPRQQQERPPPASQTSTHITTMQHPQTGFISDSSSCAPVEDVTGSSGVPRGNVPTQSSSNGVAHSLPPKQRRRVALNVARIVTQEKVPDSEAEFHLVFPASLTACNCFWKGRTLAQVPLRRPGQTSGSGFVNANSYSACFATCIRQQIQIDLWEFAQRFHQAHADFVAQKSSQSRSAPAGRGASPGRQLEIFMRKQRGIGFHSGCELIRGRDPKKWQGRFPAKRKSSSEFEDDSCDIGEQKFFLKFNDLKTLEHSSKYASGDIWILDPVSPTPVLVVAKWHNISTQSRMLEVYFLTSDEKRRFRSRHSTRIDAVRCVNAVLEMDILKHLEHIGSLSNSGNPNPSANTRPLSILPCIIDGPKSLRGTLALPKFGADFADSLKKKVLSMCKAHSLNQPQREALLHAANWLLPSRYRLQPSSSTGESDSSEEAKIFHETRAVELVHGVFGAGKSFTLSLILELLCSIVSAHGLPSRILLAAATNNAVDGVLRYMVGRGFNKFVRMGSKPAVHPEIRPYFGSSEGTEHCLVATTISSCATSVALEGDDAAFDIVVLDECSQMVEPASMLPVLKFGCKRLLLVGDPLQLPPITRSVRELKVPSGTDPALVGGYETALFVRLQKAGYQTTMLSVQYRCHPAIANVCNELFYDSKLCSGISATDRPALVPALQPLTLVDCSWGAMQQMRGSSSYNTQEADVLLRLFRSLLRAGLGPERIGIITPYRGQVAHLRNLFKRSFDEASFKAVHIGTVDAFQGGERDIIFVSSVCAGRSPGPHDTNPERLNVTISRAKHHIIFVGNASSLKQNYLWRNILKHCPSVDYHELVEAIATGQCMRGPAKVLQDVKENTNAEIAQPLIASTTHHIDSRNIAVAHPPINGGADVAQQPICAPRSAVVSNAEVADEFDVDVGDFDDADLSFGDQDDSQSVPGEDEVAAILNNVYADDDVPVEIEHIAPGPNTENELDANFDEDAAALVERPPIGGGRGRGQSRLPLDGAHGRDLSAELDSAALSDDADDAISETRSSSLVEVPAESHESVSGASKSTSAVVARASPSSSAVTLSAAPEATVDSIPDPQERFTQLQAEVKSLLAKHLPVPAQLISEMESLKVWIPKTRPKIDISDDETSSSSDEGVD